MRISKTNAEAIALKVTEPLAKKITECNTALSEAVTKLAEKTVPTEVAKVFAKHSGYIETKKHLYVYGQGIARYLSVGLSKQVPYIDNKIELSPSDAKAILKLADAVETAKQTYKEKKIRIETTIIGLGTTQRIVQALPELESYLPVKNNTAIALPITQVKKDIKALQKQA